MEGSAEAEEPVANPLRTALSQLLVRVQGTRGSVPGMQGVLTAVGDGDAWKGPAARRFSDRYLSPTSEALYGPLDRIEDDVRAARDAQPREVSPEQAEAIRRQWGL